MNQPSTRMAVTEALYDLAKTDTKTVLVSSDSIGVIKAQDFQKDYPDRVVELGISEQAAMAACAGLATCGLRPVYVSYAVFATMRACEQLRNMVAYPGLNVTIVGANGGMGAGEREGVTHQGFDDLGIVRTIPGITVISPSDAAQVRQAIVRATDIPGPVYIRTGSGREPLFWQNGEPFEFNRPRLFVDNGNDAVLFTHGFVLDNVAQACKKLAEQGIRVKAVEVSTIKPLNTEYIAGIIKDCRKVFVVEDHNVIGGLGSAICEFTAQSTPVPVTRMGLQDTYPESGTAEELYEKFGLSAADIVKTVRENRQ